LVKKATVAALERTFKIITSQLKRCDERIKVLKDEKID